MKKYLIISIVALIGLFFFLGAVFSGRLILPQYFSLGPLTIHYYGIIMAGAATAGFYLAMKRADDYKIERHKAEDILFWVIVGGFISARLYHVLSSVGYYSAYPVDAFKVWNGGLSIYGAVLGGIITLWILVKILNLKSSILNLLDWLAPCVLLGQIIGRFGNLFNYEAFGYPTNLPWKMFVEKSFRPIQYQSENFFHPWFLYECLGNLVILFILLKIIEPKYKKSPPGNLVFFYLLLYNALRFGLEFLRIDSTFIHGVRLNAAASLGLVLLAIAGLVYQKLYVRAS